MKRLVLVIMAILSVLALTACAAQPQLPYQFTTLKLIERDTISADAVIDRAGRIQAIVDADSELTIVDLEARIRGIVGYDQRPASDRLLIDALVGDLSHDLGVDIDMPLGDEHRAEITRRIEWITQAAAMAD